MRISRLMTRLGVGLLALGLGCLGFAKPILDFKHESVYHSRFCKTQQCRFIASSGDHQDGIDFDQYLYRLKNGLYFVAARYTPDQGARGYDRVAAVSLMARASASNLQKLEKFLPVLISQTAVGYDFPFRYDFQRKCARVARISYQGNGLFESMVLPGARNLTASDGKILTSDRKTLTIACIPQAYQMLSITLYLGVIDDWIDHSFGFNCDQPLRQSSVICPWFSPTVPRRIF
jgi:hypothetical protein